jgi:hypothetical protein
LREFLRLSPVSRHVAKTLEVLRHPPAMQNVALRIMDISPHSTAISAYAIS